MVAKAMDTAMEDLRQIGLRPLYIWGGGHTTAGGRAYRDAAIELACQCETQNINPDFIIVASGTGTTQGGLHAGAALALPQTNVIGISVAHGQAEGVHRVQESLNMIDARGTGEVEFHDAFLSGGYGHSNLEQTETIRWAARTEGLLLDPIYTGKAFHGLRSLISTGRIGLGSTVIFWHTGGLLNLVSSDLC
jgi:1-aminocyclopropane-1-carboxylate deaminase/D-cysteine desulfhydrase-like pyridoxal-dependent ACC family enzyme